MAEASISQDQFICPVCLDLLKDPVAIPCGHSYCMKCITDCWDQEDQKRVYSCPQCRQTFTPRPALNKNTILAEMVEKLKTNLQSAVRAGAGDVECDVCNGIKHKAVRSCLVCLNSYCQNHLEQHESFFRFKRHNLIDATGRLQEMICPQHDKMLEIYCRTDQRCICYLCTMDEHKNHDTVSTAAERTEKQKHLDETKRKYQQIIQQREKELQQMRETVKSQKRSAQAAVEYSERIFTELIRSIERSRSKVTQLIRDQEKAAVGRVKGLLKRLEQEIADLKRRNTELEQLSHTNDHIHFLQSFRSLSVSPGSINVSSITISSVLSFDGVKKSVYDLKEKLEYSCTEKIEKMFDRGETRKGAHYEEDRCPICMDSITNKTKLKCQHEFCKDCLKRSVESLGPICPVCKEVFGKVEGNQPDGTMNVVKHRSRTLPGYHNCGTIEISYNIPSGIQRGNNLESDSAAAQRQHSDKDIPGVDRALYPSYVEPIEAAKVTAEMTSPLTGLTVPLYHYLYMHEAYRKELEQMEQQYGVTICTEVSVSFKPKVSTNSESVSKISEDFQELVQQHVANLKPANIPYTFLESEIMSETLHNLQLEKKKIMMIMSARNCLLFGPQNVTDMINRRWK